MDNSSAVLMLQTVAVALIGWNLLETNKLGKKVARHEQKLDDLPCGECQPKRKH
ncbi:MAG: hypothetical protein KGJ13_07045 [Patescibacteria group bacterium]|nr:hypothetical protein [Patescibacteria group bacterium]